MHAKLVAICSAPAQFPKWEGPELAIVGRSNSGKSSLVNAIAGSKRLARVSSTPGRTREIIFFEFLCDPSVTLYLVDLPGYGYAKASKKRQEEWGRVIEHYIQHRRSLRALLVLNDIRRTPQQEELGLFQWADERGLAASLILTKADQVSKSHRLPRAAAARKALSLRHSPLLCSIHDESSIKRLRGHISQLVTG